MDTLLLWHWIFVLSVRFVWVVTNLQYPLMMRPATTWLSFSQCLTLPETGAPSNTTSSMIPSLPAEPQAKLLTITSLKLNIFNINYMVYNMIPFLLTISSKQEKITLAPRLYPINVIGRFPCQKQLCCNSIILWLINEMLFYRTIRNALWRSCWLPVALPTGLQRVLSQWMWLSVCRHSRDCPEHWLLRRGQRARQWLRSDLYRDTFIHDIGKLKSLFPVSLFK